MNLILFGFKGCGKTYFGKKLAEKMHRPFVDTDDLLLALHTKETGESLSVREIHQKIGEDAFRALEKRALLQLSELSNTIIALGGGAVLDPENVEALQNMVELVYLVAGAPLLRRRMLLNELPSFLKDEGSFEEMFHTRLPIYESIRARRIDLEILDEPAVLTALRNILILEEPLE
jgi:shikimate kinase